MPIQAALFDVFGTTVDCEIAISTTACDVLGLPGKMLTRRSTEIRAGHGSLVRTCKEAIVVVTGGYSRVGGVLNRSDEIDWPELVRAWRRLYAPAMDQVRRGELKAADGSKFVLLDDLHRINLDKVLNEFGLSDVPEAARLELVQAWHSLQPWPDTIPGLNAFRESGIQVGTLSNGNALLLRNMSRNHGLPWDHIFSAETFGHYKPDAQVYLGACQRLGLAPQNVLMVACHKDDLNHAALHGMKTAFVARPQEWGEVNLDTSPGPFDFNSTSFVDLARQVQQRGP